MARRRTFRFLTPAALAAAACLSGANVAAEVGFVNIPLIMDKAPQAKAAREKLQQEFSGRRAELEDCRKDIENLDGMLRREGRDMKKSRRDRMIDEVRSRRRECGHLREAFEEDFNRRRSEELSTLQKQISRAVEDIAEKRGLNLIVGPPIIYVDERKNLTDKVLDTLSRENR